MNSSVKLLVKNKIAMAIRNKFSKYNPEPAKMPFHTRLLGQDRLALYSFIHSLNTNFGTSIFEPVAVELAKSRFIVSEKQKIAGNKISNEAQQVIQKIMDDLTAARIKPNRENELSQIRSVIQSGEFHKVKPTKSTFI